MAVAPGTGIKTVAVVRVDTHHGYGDFESVTQFQNLRLLSYRCFVPRNDAPEFRVFELNGERWLSVNSGVNSETSGEKSQFDSYMPMVKNKGEVRKR